MKRKKIKLSQAEKDRLKEAVRKAESKTSGEIVPFIVASSGDYLWVHLVWALAGAMAGTFAIWCQSTYSHFALTFGEMALILWSGVLIGALLPLIPFLKRISVSKTVLTRNVNREVMASFVGAGLTETKDRTGVLIYLSVFERRIQILADKGINSKAPKNYWQSHVDAVVKGIHSGRPSEVLSEVIEEIGEQLSASFPRAADDVNELSDEIRLEPADE